MDALMAQLRTASRGEPTLGASASANPQLELFYNLVAFPSLP